jgi:hypothetical protein
VQLIVTTTITAATVVEIVNTVYNTTKTTTIFNTLPPGYYYHLQMRQVHEWTLLPTCGQGTRLAPSCKYNPMWPQCIQLIFLTNNVTSAFPSFFINWGDSYVWSGTLQTTGNTPNVTECVTAPPSGSTVQISSNPQPTDNSLYVPSFGSDSRGLLFTLSWEYHIALYEEFKTLFPDQGALQTCASSDNSGAGANFAASFMTVSSTQFVNLETTSASPGSLGTSQVPSQTGISSPAGQPTSQSTNQPTSSPSPTASQPYDSNPVAPVSAAPTSYIIGTQTILPGSQIIYSGTTISLSPSGTDLVINGATTPLPAPQVASARTQSNPLLPSDATTASTGLVYGSC